MVPLRKALLRRKNWICRSCRALATASRDLPPERREYQRLPKLPARTRFAPSPTGFLHLGSLRTALYNYLLARATGGQFLLRIEDTDKTRIIADAEARLLQDLKWAGLQWDEGPDIGGPFGPYKQSERTVLYQEHAQLLLQNHNAYRCFCSPARLNSLAQHQNQYDGACRVMPEEESEERAGKGETHVIRLKTPNRPPEYVDLVYGKVGKQKLGSVAAASPGGLAFEDPILLKSDGLPTYHLANVVDDHYMKITHVIRATEWMSSTPKHLVIYNAFGWNPPRFAHVGLLQDGRQNKLSKRDLSNVSLDLRNLQNEGIFPEALVNYVALYGWSHTSTSDFLPMEELVNVFDLKFTKGNSVVMPEKLGFLQKKYAEKYVSEDGVMLKSMIQRVLAFAEKSLQEHPQVNGPKGKPLEERIANTLRQCKSDYRDPHQFYQSYFYFFKRLQAEDYLSTKAGSRRHLLAEIHDGERFLRNGGKLLPLSIKNTVDHWMEPVLQRLNNLPGDKWNASLLQEVIKGILNDVEPHTKMLYSDWQKKNLDVQLFLRWALLAGWSGPSNSVAMEILGKETTLQRLVDASTVISE